MINTIISLFQHLEKKIIALMKIGFTSSFIVCLLSSIILITYKCNPISLDFYYSGLLLFQAGMMIAVSFIICGVVFDTLQKNLIK